MLVKKIERVLFIIVGGSFLLLCAAVGIATFSDLTVETKLDMEMEAIEKVLNKDTVDENQLSQYLSRDIVGGTYNLVEKAYKKYVKDIVKLADDIKIFNDSVDLKYVFTIDNIKEDGPDFPSTKEVIKNYKEQLEKNKKKLDKKKEENFEEFLPVNKKNTYYRKYLQENIQKLFRMKYLKNILVDFSKKEEMIEKTDTLLNFLIDNKEDWEIKKDEVTFNTEQNKTDYDQLLKEWEELFEKKKSIFEGEIE